ncbi:MULTISPECIES: GNAT family N-acetyltransferase [unclassified Shewanella]|uniref:GNAT family N-acetyltransferase n=1 Tax=unclassified Shewanella TaxID=196818 RepID=UPI001BC4320C|nr:MULTISPECIES: GNAT family N-acetyltransferase [unclassified Shewanella]GIU18929.1 hypothetical protein TUM4444_34540 [Shewanella sp. MBTL60-112-B1]GIU40457.1 hypothetical protein TUM4445_39630 [Shewanella sp. MBTL60-112-B2]
MKRDDHGDVELGYVLAKAYWFIGLLVYWFIGLLVWSMGYVIATYQAMLRNGNDSIGVSELIAGTSVDNHASLEP